MRLNNEKSIALGFTILLLLSGLSGCTNEKKQSDKFTTKDISIKEISLTEVDISYNKSYDNYTSGPFKTNNLTGNGKTWIILENYLVRFDKNRTVGMQLVLFKFNTITAATDYLSLIIPYIKGTTNVTEQPLDPIGDESVFLKDQESENTTFHQLALYFRLGHIVAIFAGVNTEESTLIDYAKILESKIQNKLNTSP